MKTTKQRYIYTDAEWIALLEAVDCAARKRSRRFADTFVVAALDRIAPLLHRVPYSALRREALREVHAAYVRWWRGGGCSGVESSDIEKMENVNSESRKVLA